MIRAQKLAKKYQGKTVLSGLDMTVQPGELVVLQGANGAGKTTLIRILATLTRPDRGDFSIGEISGSKDPQEARKQIGVMLHQTLLYGDLTALENIEFYASLAGTNSRRKISVKKIEQVGLDPLSSKPVRSYSRGMQQRLSLARALINDPPVLLLDEPFTGMDAAGQEFLVNLLDQLKKEGRTILMTGHDAVHAARLASRVDYLYHGRIVCSFSGKELDPTALVGSIRLIEAGQTVFDREAR